MSTTPNVLASETALPSARALFPLFQGAASLKLTRLNDTMRILPETKKDLSLLKKTPIGKEFPLKPYLLRNVVKRLDLPIKVNIPAMKPLPASFSFHTKPKDYQLTSLLMLHNFSMNLLLDPGLGKTKILLDFIHLRKYARVLVVCPSPLKEVWRVERDIHRPEVALQLIEHATDSLVGPVAVMSYAMATLKGPELVRWRPELIIVDEALIQNRSQVFESLFQLVRGSKERILSSGTLVNNGPMNLYTPLRFSEPSLVGGSFTRFRDRYVTTRKLKDGTVIPTGKAKNLNELRDLVAAVSFVLRKDEVLKDFPEKSYVTKSLEMPREYQLLWTDITSNSAFTAGGQIFDVANPLIAAGKLAQLSAGFIYLDGKVPFFLSENPKHAALLSHLKKSKERAIVWFRYSAQGASLKSLLEANGISYILVDGKTKAVAQKVKEFNTREVQVLLAQERVLNYGQTIMGSEDNLFPELSGSVKEQHFLSESFSYQVSRQQEDRTHRLGLTFTPSYYRYLVTPLDYKVRETLERRGDVSDKILVSFIKKE